VAVCDYIAAGWSGSTWRFHSGFRHLLGIIIDPITQPNSRTGSKVGVDAVWKTHDLGDLWKTLTEVLDGYGHNDPDQTDPIVAEIVAEFAKVDPKSFSYRYPVDTKGKPIPIAHSELDLSALADVMEALEGYFSGSDGYLDSLRDAGP
ncbi:hypothetical protein NOI87_31530, partial [Neorhizobium galegae]|nr:hypothetical protein [Neorhizobium galegae]